MNEYTNWPGFPAADPGMVHGFQPFSGARILDIGANIGIWSAYCASHGAQVVSFEPDPVTFSVLFAMIRREGFSIDARNSAVWKYTGTCSFKGFTRDVNHNGALAHIQCPDNGLFRKEEQVTCVSFSEIVGDVEWDCVKVDTEGSEYEMLLNAPVDVLKRIKFLYVEFHPWWVEAGLHDSLLAHLSRSFSITGLEENYAMCRRIE